MADGGFVTFDIKTKKMQKLLTEMRKQGKSSRKLMVLFYGKVKKEVFLNFRLESAPPDIFSGPPGNIRKPWKPLSSYTKAARLGSRQSTSKVGSILQASGQLRASMGKVKIITNSSMTFGTPSSISAPNHFGATIRPVRSKFLALPFPGVIGRPRDYKDAFFLGRTLFRKGDDGELVPLFFLKSEVKIPARPHITISERTLLDMRKLTWNFLVKSTGGTNG